MYAFATLAISAQHEFIFHFVAISTSEARTFQMKTLILRCIAYFPPPRFYYFVKFSFFIVLFQWWHVHRVSLSVRGERVEKIEVINGESKKKR